MLKTCSAKRHMQIIDTRSSRITKKWWVKHEKEKKNVPKSNFSNAAIYFNLVNNDFQSTFKVLHAFLSIRSLGELLITNIFKNFN